MSKGQTRLLTSFWLCGIVGTSMGWSRGWGWQVVLKNNVSVTSSFVCRPWCPMAKIQMKFCSRPVTNPPWPATTVTAAAQRPSPALVVSEGLLHWRNSWLKSFLVFFWNQALAGVKCAHRWQVNHQFQLWRFDALFGWSWLGILKCHSCTKMAVFWLQEWTKRTR